MIFAIHSGNTKIVTNSLNFYMQPVKHLFLILLAISASSVSCQQTVSLKKQLPGKEIVLPGSYNTNDYLPLLKGKKIGIVANNTSKIIKTHLVDSLISLKVNVTTIFGPEHGFRGDQPDGKEILNGKDPKTGIEVISLYGNHKKPIKADLENIELMIFDIQDVGVRFYTYISTLTYVMEACAENNIPLIVFDRPNPNGYYVDGPVLEPAFKSFVGMHKVPVVYGMTIGEYAKMINGEKWLQQDLQCNLTVIKCNNYTHKTRYQLPEKPSPNLQDMKAVYLYPSLCLFEGTVVSVGRGTDSPFKVFGHPKLTDGTYSFTPKPIKGISEDPPLKGQLCFGQNLEAEAEKIKNEGKIELVWLIEAYKDMNTKTEFFTNYFDKLAGNSKLREQIIAGLSETEIRKSWQPDLDAFKKIRMKYLLYPDFE
jgi:uncharacterized protein YbbC (DUF1343 family)